ncbi:MAG: BBP7 family outer membrane beta-barrel protein, partial [Gemmataceae bacterium]
MLRFLAAVGLLGGLSAAVAQSVSPPVPVVPVVPVDPLPPLTLPAEATSQSLPNGTVVSQPLQPGAVEVGPPKPGVLDPSTLPPMEPLRVVKVGPDLSKPFAKSWDSAEVLLWWTKPQTLPPLVTTSPVGLPLLGGPNTSVLFGGRPQDPPGSGGGRFVLGWALGAGDRAGYEIGYSFLGTNTTTAPFRGGGNWRGPTLGIPLVNPHTGAEDVVLVSSLTQRGAVDVSQSVRVQGWELTGLVNLYNSPQFKVHALTGYRYFMMNEGVRIDTQSAFDPQVLAAANVTPDVLPQWG